MNMNRVLFLILLIVFLLVPISINSVNDDGISYFDLVIEITEEFIEKLEIDEKSNIAFSNEQKQVIDKKLMQLENTNNRLFYNFEEIQNENLKKINEFIAINRWQEFSGIKGIYLSGYHFLEEEKIGPIKDILSNTVINTIVLDVKSDNGHLLYDSDILEVEKLKNERIKYDTQTLQSFKEEFDIYLIGRVVAFQDPIFSKNYPESSITDISTKMPFNQNGQYFLDPSDSKSKEYILNVALEACLLGFDEIQFDYIRYPDTDYQGLVYDEESNFENRTKNINSFLQNATNLLHDNGCLASADIFGYALNSRSDRGIGQ